MYEQFQTCLPNNETKPHAVHTTKQNPTLPEYRNAAVGETKIPEPEICT